MANGLEELDDLLIGAKVNSIKSLLIYKLENEKIWSVNLIKLISELQMLLDKILIDQEEGKKHE
jgi:hypothetical protein